MKGIAFSTSPPMDWNNGVGNRSIIESLERLVLRARATDESIQQGEWAKIWKAVGEVMGNSDPTVVSDANQSGIEYLDTLIAALGGSIASISRNVYKLNGVDQYLELMEERRNGSFLIGFTFYGTTGIEHPLVGHPTDASYIRINAAGDLLIQIGASPLITIPSAQVGDISTPKRIDVGRANSSVRVRVDNTVVSTLPNHGNDRFGVNYFGANGALTEFSDGVLYDIQFTNNRGDHFFLVDDLSATLADTGTVGESGTIVNYNQANWTTI